MGPGFESPLGHHVGAKSALLRRLFMLTHKKASSARSLAPPFQIATASLGFDLVLGADLIAVHLYCCDSSNERGSTFEADFLDCPKSRPLFYPQSLVIQEFYRDKLSVRIWTPKSKQLKMTTEAAENLESEPLFPEPELLLFPEKCVLILLWRLKVQSGMRALLIVIMESKLYTNYT